MPEMNKIAAMETRPSDCGIYSPPPPYNDTQQSHLDRVAAGIELISGQVTGQGQISRQTPSVSSYPVYGASWGRFSQRVVCPHCNVGIQTQTKYVNGLLTHLACFAVFWLTCCCCCIPYFLKELKDVEHSCPDCKRVIGIAEKNLF